MKNKTVGNRWTIWPWSHVIKRKVGRAFCFFVKFKLSNKKLSSE